MDKHVEECREQFQNKQELYDTNHSKLLKQLKEEIRIECEAREKLCSSSRTTSAHSSITSFHLESNLSQDTNGASNSTSPEQDKTMQSEIKDGSTEDNSLLSDIGASDCVEIGTSDPTEIDTNDCVETNQ